MAWLRRTARTPEGEFADEVIVLVHDLFGLKARKTDDFALRIERPGRTATLMNLHTIYAETRALDPVARAQRLRTAVLAMAGTPRPAAWDDAAPLLLPAVRAVSWVTATAGQNTARGQSRSFARPLAPFVSVMCVIDSEHAMTYAKSADLAAWGVTDDQALRTAAGNLARMPLGVSRNGPQAHVVGPDGYISSWLAAPAALARVAADVGRTVVALAPSRDQLILLDTDEPGTVAVLERALEEYQSAPRQLSPVPYLIRDDSVEPWDPPAGHPARPVVDRAARILADTEYSRQKTVLDDELQKTGQDVYVADYNLMQRQDISMWSWTTWARQVTDGLVPAADVIVLVDNDDPDSGLTIRWSDALNLAGDALQEEPAFDPPRWRYQSWPDNTALAALKQRAVPFPPPA
jgi:hypothetical protein